METLLKDLGMVLLIAGPVIGMAIAHRIINSDSAGEEVLRRENAKLKSELARYRGASTAERETETVTK